MSTQNSDVEIDKSNQRREKALRLGKARRDRGPAPYVGGGILTSSILLSSTPPFFLNLYKIRHTLSSSR